MKGRENPLAGYVAPSPRAMLMSRPGGQLCGEEVVTFRSTPVVVELDGGRQASYAVMGALEPLLWIEGGPGFRPNWACPTVRSCRLGSGATSSTRPGQDPPPRRSIPMATSTRELRGSSTTSASAWTGGRLWVTHGVA